jgi:CARDB
MRPIAAVMLIAACALGLLCAATAGATPPRAQLRGYSCVKALDPGSRSIAVTAVMRPLTGTERLELRFDLLSKPPGQSEFSVEPPKAGLGGWISPSDPTLGSRHGDVWKLIKPVFNLAAPATYRLRVMFRWLGAHGSVLQTVTRLSPGCHQPELRPDLLVESFTAASDPTHPSLDQFTAVIANAGATAAGPFDVVFADGTKTVTRSIVHLGAHMSRTLVFSGPPCSAGAPATLTLDPQGQVSEINPSNNTASTTCS